ncbi:MAG: VWA domain-containing protein [Gammaproteobacteria bacterium]
MRLRRRDAEGFNLSFLDIMSCGLGAVILLFMLVKYETSQSGEAVSALQSDLRELQGQKQSAQEQSGILTQSIADLNKQMLQMQQVKEQAQVEDAELTAKLSELAKAIAILEEEDARPTAPKEKPVQEHLIGLRVEGKRILIMLDYSASMAEERLIDIIRTKVSSIAVKRAASKWQRTLKIVHWILDRVPENSSYSVMAFNDKAAFLVRQEWIRKEDEKLRIEMDRALDVLHPHQATNLYAALQLVASRQSMPTDIYIITDSLPTIGKSQSRKCRLRSGAQTVSSKCRQSIFNSAAADFAQARRNVLPRINAVLLPIEGDAQAAPYYWMWAASTGGTMIAPVASWP